EQEQMTENSHVITVEGLGTSQPHVSHQKDCDRMVESSSVSQLLENKNKGITINNKLAKEWFTIVFQRLTKFSSTTNPKTVQDEYGTDELDKNRIRNYAKKQSSKISKQWISEATNYYGGELILSTTKSRLQKW
ncbi:1943_t:CDS:2, partial [Racocetra fulgida]